MFQDEALREDFQCSSLSGNPHPGGFWFPTSLFFLDFSLAVLDTPPETRLEPKTLPLQQVPNQQDDGVEKVSTEIPAEILDEFLLPPESQETPLFPLEIPDINELLAWFDPVESMSEDPHTEGLAGAKEVRPSDSFNKMPARKCISTYHVEGKDPLAALLSAPAVEPLDGATLPTPGKWKTPENAANLVQTSGPFAITPLVGSGLMIGSSGPRLSDPKMPGRRKSKLPAATPPVPPSQAPKRSGSDGKGLSTDKGLAPKKRKVEVAAGCEFSQYLCQGDRENCYPGASTSGTSGEAMPGQSSGNSLLLTPCSVLEQTVADIQKSSMTEPMGPAEVVTPDKGQQQKLGAHGNDKGKGAVPGKGKFKTPGGRGGKKIPQQEAQPSKVPRSHLEMQMLESIQVFHPLGKKLQPATPAPKPPAPPPSKAPASTPTVSPQIILGLKRRLEALANQRAKIPRPAPGGRKDRQTDTPQKDGQMDTPKKEGQADIARKDGQIDTPRKEGQVFPPKRLFQIPGNPGHGAVPPSSSSTAPAQQRPPPPPHSSTSLWHPPPSHSPMVARSNPLQELEVSLPITPEQRPEREAMKRKAQKERELAAQYMKIGRRQFLVERQRDWALEAEWGYLSLIRR
ncbi:nascent polypeptide-associated complex subunit alpha, muscle-specific form [Alligator mississippiensis]|uniref:nascent polypeptide-associated complex subunit alpha, muscle-specific form n=1 Tax=Alligator mississippiensis TaxID=8496 RepID=UPI0028775F86|nr:nascent polypeptide-associated complex subunit alpha, muscle-specific form [Alligator mississippiensis]